MPKKRASKLEVLRRRLERAKAQLRAAEFSAETHRITVERIEKELKEAATTQ